MLCNWCEKPFQEDELGYTIEAHEFHLVTRETTSHGEDYLLDGFLCKSCADIAANAYNMFNLKPAEVEYLKTLMQDEIQRNVVDPEYPDPYDSVCKHIGQQAKRILKKLITLTGEIPK